MKLNQATTAKAALTAAAAATLLSLAACGSNASYGEAPESAVANQGSSAASTGAPESPPAAAPATSAASAPASAAAAKISIKDFKYQGAQTVSPGATIAVTNADIEAHTITADQGSAFDVVIPVGAGKFTAPTKPGTYTYHCSFHGNMKGTLVVK